MNAPEKLYAMILQNFPTERITTMQIANLVGLTRSVVSGYLSQLEKEGQVLKYSGRPVYWQIKPQKTAFDGLIGCHGSLNTCISHAIEAIVYPPRGIPMCIIGPEGSGKKTFARAVYDEAIRREVIANTVAFECINCFYYMDQEKPAQFLKDLNSKIEKVRSKKNDMSGYLAIYNIQFLSNIEQHHLFDIINKCQLSGPRFILTTVENSSDLSDMIHLVGAIQINFPCFNKRPLNERVEFVVRFLHHQAIKINRKILISPSKVVQLAGDNRITTISELNNKLQTVCAETFARSIGEGPLIIGKMKSNTISITNDLKESLDFSITRILELIPSVNELISQLIDSLKRGETITEQNFLTIRILRQVDTVLINDLLTSSSQSVQEIAIKNITRTYGITFPKEGSFWKTTFLSLAFSKICCDNLTIDKNMNVLREEIQKKYPRTLYVFDQFLSNLRIKEFQRPYYYISFFQLMSEVSKKIESIKYNAIILTHGESTATSIQHMVNTLCGNYLFEAFDMPVDISIREINVYVHKYLAQLPISKGTIVLFDMGSLKQMFSSIKKVSNHDLLVINNVSTAIALDVGLRVQRNESFKKITEASKKFGLTMGIQYYEGISDRDNIIVSCMSGVGLSSELKNLLDKTLSKPVKIIVLDYKRLNALLKNNDRTFFNNTKMILTTTDIKNDNGIENVNIYNVFDDKFTQNFRNILLSIGETSRSIDMLIEKLLRLFSIEGIKDRLQVLNPDVVIKEVQSIVSHYEKFYSVKFKPKLKLNLYMHMSLMIERTMMTRRDASKEMDKLALSEDEQAFFELSKNILRPIEVKLNLTVDDSEIILIYQLMHSQIL